VAALAAELALRFGLDALSARDAGWLHDVSAVIPNSERVFYAQVCRLTVLPAEEQLPMILHQKLSRLFAEDIFNIHDQQVLNAIACHTTLNGHAKSLDLVLFVADKLAWDQPGEPPYADHMQQALDTGLQAAACVYLKYLWERRENLQVIHPFMVDAVQNLCEVKV
jgi:predicted HD superfamily hydrolase involved in NAD metabolism